MQNETDQPVALITGITGGFGRAFASTFTSRGYRVIGISRNTPAFPVWKHVAVDLTDPAALERSFRSLASQLDRLDALVNNAGIGLYDYWEDMDDIQLRQTMELNFFSVVSLTRILTPLLKKTGGCVVNVASVAGKMPVPVMGAYCGSKYALVAYSDTLRAELARGGVHVLNVIVGRINTGFSSRALGGRKPPRTPFSGAPEKLAHNTLTAIRKRRRQLIYPGWYRFVLFLQRLFPAVFDRLAMNKWKTD